MGLTNGRGAKEPTRQVTAVDEAKRLAQTQGGYPAGNQDPSKRGLGNEAGRGSGR